jgi:Tfp pilus assembly protein PilE
MHCNQCGKENRSGSKFCRHCGTAMLEGFNIKTSIQKISWKNPIIIILVALILLGILSFGGYKAYAYYSVQSKINNAKKLQSKNDFNDSLTAINNISGSSLTAGQQNSINKIKTDDQKFITFKASFDTAVALENPPSTDNLQTALKDLQSIDSSYLDYKNVQTEISTVQNLLMTALQNDANTNKEAAATAKAQAAAATSAKAQAEEKAKEAQSEADSAAANAQQEAATAATNAKTTEVLKSFYNELFADYKNLEDNGISYYNNGMSYLNNSEGSTALVDFAKANAVFDSVSQDTKNMNTQFTGMPQTYIDAANNLQEASYYYGQATNSAIDETSYSSDTSATTNYDSSTGDSYKNSTYTFLENN